MDVIGVADLPFSRIAHELVGDDSEERTVKAGEIVIVPPDTPHLFRATGDGPLRQVDIHVNPRFKTEWLED